MSRWIYIFIVMGLVASGILYDRVSALPPQKPESVVSIMASNPSVASPPSINAAWYCPVGSADPGGYADHQVDITNLSADEATAAVNILTADGRGPTTRIDVPPLSISHIKLSDFVTTDVAGAVVEVTGGQGLVSHTLATPYGQTEGPCATAVGSEWYFANGRTEADSVQYVALMNPFPEDAVYDLEVVSEARRPRTSEGQFVPGQSVKVIRIDKFRTREQHTAVKIKAQTGRLVVERLQTVDGVFGPTGASLQLGLSNLADRWYFPSGRLTAEGENVLTIYNPSPSGLEIMRAQGDLEAQTVDKAFELDQRNTSTVQITLWPVNPSDRAFYGTTTIERSLPPGGLEVIDLFKQVDRFKFPVPFELGVEVRVTQGPYVAAERWQSGQSYLTDEQLLENAGKDEESDGDTTDDEDTGEEATDDEATDDTEGTDADVETADLDAIDEVAQPVPDDGISASAGTPVTSTHWIAPWLPVSGDSTLMSIMADTEANLEIRTLVNGAVIGPKMVTVPAEGIALVPIVSPDPELEGVAVDIRSDVPVVVETSVVTEGEVSIIAAVPTIG